MKPDPLAGYLESVELRMLRPSKRSLRRDAIRVQIDNLTRLKRRYERAEETNPSRLSLMA